MNGDATGNLLAKSPVRTRSIPAMLARPVPA